MEVIERMAAARQGLTRFYTGRLCHKGHDAERYVASGNCVECAKKVSGAYAQARKAARFAAGEVEYVRVVPTALVETLDATIKAHMLLANPLRLCEHGKPPSEVCLICDIGTGGE